MYLIIYRCLFIIYSFIVIKNYYRSIIFMQNKCIFSWIITMTIILTCLKWRSIPVSVNYLIILYPVDCFLKLHYLLDFSNQSATLIDNIFSTNIDKKEVSGILLNHISDHQLLFTYIENAKKVSKFINIKKTDPLSVDNFINELREQNIYERMHHPFDTNPNNNYEIFMTQFLLAKNKHLPIKCVRYQ